MKTSDGATNPTETSPVSASTGSITVSSLSDLEKINQTAHAAAKQKSIELLYDYTKFHIGVYLTLTGSYLTAAAARFHGAPVLQLNLWFIAPAVFFTVVAGMAGGVIVSSLTQTVGESSTSFLDSKIGPWGWKRLHFKARNWTYLEHTSFWMGLVCAIFSFVPVCYYGAFKCT